MSPGGRVSLLSVVSGTPGNKRWPGKLNPITLVARDCEVGSHICIGEVKEVRNDSLNIIRGDVCSDGHTLDAH